MDIISIKGVNSGGDNLVGKHKDIFNTIENYKEKHPEKIFAKDVDENISLEEWQ